MKKNFNTFVWPIGSIVFSWKWTSSVNFRVIPKILFCDAIKLKIAHFLYYKVSDWPHLFTSIDQKLVFIRVDMVSSKHTSANTKFVQIEFRSGRTLNLKHILKSEFLKAILWQLFQFFKLLESSSLLQYSRNLYCFHFLLIRSGKKCNKNSATSQKRMYQTFDIQLSTKSLEIHSININGWWVNVDTAFLSWKSDLKEKNNKWKAKFQTKNQSENYLFISLNTSRRF